MLGTEYQPVRHGDKIAYGGKIVFTGYTLGYRDGIGVVDPKLAKEAHPLCRLGFSGLGVDKIVEGNSGGYIGGVQMQEGGQEGTVIAVHHIGVSLEYLPPGIHGGHFLPYIHLELCMFLYQVFYHAMNNFHLGKSTVIDNNGVILFLCLTGTEQKNQNRNNKTGKHTNFQLIFLLNYFFALSGRELMEPD
jgi:hypothetical protein